MNQKSLLLLLIPLILVVGAIIVHVNNGTTSDDGIVSVAVDAMTENGHYGLLQGNGLNISPDTPFVSSRQDTQASVTIPYVTNSGPVIDPKVNLTLNPQTNKWQAVSYTDGGGVLHPIDWHPDN